MDTKNLYDAVVIGAGPAGLTAGLYLARARYRVLIVEKGDIGGQITITEEVVNYPGVGKTSGKALTATMRQQALGFGAEFMSAEVTGLDLDGDVKTVHTTRGDLQTFGIILATGANPRKLGFEGEEEFAGRGVAYCATCDGEFFTGKEVVVIGGGFAAAEESVFLTKYATKVTMLIREEDFTCDKSVADEARNHPKIEVHYGVEVDKVVGGQGGLQQAVIHDVETGDQRTWAPADGGTFGLFVFAGYVPATGLVRGLVELDRQGYVVTHDYLETSVPGVYAAGDLRVKNLRQVVTATADGATAAVEMERYASAMSEKTGLVPPRPGSEGGTKPAAAPASQETTAPAKATTTDGMFSEDIQRQLAMVFGKMARPVTLRLELDDTAVSRELEGFIGEMVKLSDGKLVSEIAAAGDQDGDGRATFGVDDALPLARPCVRVCAADDNGDVVPTGLAFHGVPSGHEFNSFVLGLYNAAGPGQPLDEATKNAIAAIDKPVDVMLMVSLTCTMCPETVLSAQRIAADNPNVTAEAYDISHFPELKDHYGVMSVPCIVINHADGTKKVEFGKKNIANMIDLITQ